MSGTGDEASSANGIIAIATLVITTLTLLGIIFQYFSVVQRLPSADKEVMGLCAEGTLETKIHTRTHSRAGRIRSARHIPGRGR
jgi:hypothetical protein